MDWLREHQPELAVDPHVLAEIRYGIYLLPAGARRKNLERWFLHGVQSLRCVPWDADTGLRWAKLIADLRIAGYTMPLQDSLVAATALKHDLVLVTRNIKDFRHAGAKLLDPFQFP